MNASSFANQHFGWQKLEELIAYIVFLISYDGIIRDEQEKMNFYRIYSQDWFSTFNIVAFLNYFTRLSSYLMNYSFNNTFALYIQLLIILTIMNITATIVNTFYNKLNRIEIILNLDV